MKGLLAVISFLVCGAVAEPPAPYAPSGWRPNGPAFELPQPGQAQQQPASYLPPIDPRNPTRTPDVEYGTPQEEDVSVQGLPPQREEAEFFQRSPINGQQNVGPAFTADIRNINQNFQQSQYQQQQQIFRELERQRQLDAQIAANRLPRPQAPAVFAPRTTPATTEATTPEATTVASTTEISLNEGETLESPKKEKVSVEVTAQKIQEYPGELFLSSLAQLQLQPQFVPLQFGQLKAPLYLQPVQAQKQVAGFDAQTHFAALPSIIAQQKLQQQNAEQGFQNPALLIAEQPQAVPQLQPVTAYQQPQFQTEQVAVQPQALYGQPEAEPVAQYQPVNYQPQLQQPQLQLQPLPQFAAQSVAVQPQAQYQPQPVAFQPQPAAFQPQPAAFQPQPAAFQPQPAAFQPQPAAFQPQPAAFQPAQFQPQPAQFQPQAPQFQPQPNNQDAENIDQSSYQPQLYQSPFLAPQPGQPQPGYIQAQLINYPGQDLTQFQGQFQQQSQLQPQKQGPDALQSGLDVNQQGNGIEEPQDQEEDGQDEGTTATAVATAFGTRTQPRVFTQYGAPFPVPRVQAAPAPTTTEAPVEEVTDDGPVVAHAVAIADGSRKKSAKLRRSRIRPIFTLDRSGHLVLAQGQ
ncbi:uncharacterized protein LOC142984244 [Anticarsia gemmatalis]|uniref:uncharacterized protein LOC142984244 n=1 Tax=Anticarsia gemmatalis TaxID=129554 RepID=UPI003F77647C